MLGLRPAFWYLWIGILVNRLGTFVVPFLMLYLTGPRGLTAAAAGSIVSLYGVGAIAAGPAGGAIADRFGRRFTMLLSTVLTAAALLHLGAARAPLHIAGAALVLGFVSDAYRPAVNAAIVDLVPIAERTRAFGYMYWASNLGFAGAMTAGGLIARRGYALLFLLDAATTLLLGLIVYLRVPESHPTRGAERAGPPGSAVDFTIPYRDRRFVRFVFAQFLVAVLFWQSGTTLPLDLRAHGLLTDRIGELLALNGVLIVLLQPLSVRWVSPLRRDRVMAAGTLLVAAGFGANALGHTTAWYAIAIAIWSAGEIVFTPVTPVVIGEMAPIELRASYQGVAQLAWGLASVVAPVAGAAALSRLGTSGLWGGCLLVGALAALMHLTSGGYEAREPH